MNQPYYKKIIFNQKLKNFFVYGIGQAINIVTPLLITPYLIFVCGLNNLGLIAVAQSLAYILCVVIDYSSYVIGVREVSINRTNSILIEKIFVTHFTSKTFLLLFTGLIICLIVAIVPYFRDNARVILYSFPILIAQAINPTWFFQGLEEFKWISFINIFSKLLFVFGVFMVVKQPDDFVWVNLILGTVAILANLIGFIYSYKANKFSITTVQFIEVKRLITNDFSFCFSQLFFAIRNYSSVIIIGFFAGDFIAGQFKVIEQIINLLRTYLQLFFKFSYSYICLEIDRNFRKGLKIWKVHNGLNLLFTLFLIVLIIVFSKQILLFFKVAPNLIPQLENYLHIAVVIPLLIGFTLPMEQLIFCFNKNKEYIRITIFITIFNILGVSAMIFWLDNQAVFLFLIAIEMLLIIIYSFMLKPYLIKTTT